MEINPMNPTPLFEVKAKRFDLWMKILMLPLFIFQFFFIKEIDYKFNYYLFVSIFLIFILIDIIKFLKITNIPKLRIYKESVIYNDGVIKEPRNIPIIEISKFQMNILNALEIHLKNGEIIRISIPTKDIDLCKEILSKESLIVS